MKRKIFTLLNIIGFSAIGQSQCTFEKIFPVKHGMSIFKATTTIAYLKDIKEDKEENKYSGIINYWNKPDYLNGDSVFKTSLYYDYLYHDCFKGDENKLLLRFVDDKLYKILITLTFSNSKFEKCMENYNTLVAIFKKHFVDWEKINISNNTPAEQIGEGYWFYPTTKNKKDDVKIENASIEYEIEYEKEWNDFKKEYYQTGNVKKYILEIGFVNLAGTKLTNE